MRFSKKFISANGLTPKENIKIGSFTSAVIFFLILIAGNEMFGAQIFHPAFLAAIGAISFPATWILLRIHGIWKY